MEHQIQSTVQVTISNTFQGWNNEVKTGDEQCCWQETTGWNDVQYLTKVSNSHNCLNSFLINISGLKKKDIQITL